MRDPTVPMTEVRVAAYVRGELDARERAAFEADLDREPQWLAVIALLARREHSGAPRGDEAPASAIEPARSTPGDDDALLERLERDHAARLRPGSRLGRYEVEEPLGAGGMGAVHAAYDPELKRRVALKVLRGGASRGQSRLLGEARALARLNDRHVIIIHDVGTWRSRVFIAMELLEGQTLHAWRAAAPRRWREIVDVFVDAGRGLAAAHDAGVIHRDFKPTNVMRTPEGRVVVLDFGIAHAPDDAQDGSAATAEAGSHDDDPMGTGPRERVFGTPAYMAPEQRRGEPCGPQADQYAYCVALFEALHGHVPCQGEAGEGFPRAAPDAVGRWPRGLARAIDRGLADDPSARHASMRDLVDALVAAARPRSRRAAAVLVAAAATAAIGIALVSEREPPCTGAARALAVSVDDAHLDAAIATIAATGRPWSEPTAATAGAGLHAFADAWIAEHTAACRATRIDETQPEAILDLRMQCLDRRRRSLGALTDLLVDADAELAAEAVRAVDTLPPVHGCRDVESLRAPLQAPTDPGSSARAEALLDAVAQIEALRGAVRLDEAAALAERAVVDADALGHPPTEAEARLVAGWVHADRGEHARAEVELRAALAAAEAGQHDEAIAVAWHRLAWVVGYKLARHDEGRRFAEHAAAWSRRLGAAPHHELPRMIAQGWIEHDAGEFEAALRHFEAALEVAEGLPDDVATRPHDLALAHNGIGAAALGLADLARARDAFAHAEAQLVSRLGPDHPDVARVRNNLASLLRGLGQTEAALAMFEHNLATFEASVGADHPLVGQTLVNIAVAELDLGRDADAERHAERAIAVLSRAHDPDHPMVAKAHTLRGDARVQLDRPLEAIADLQRALDIERATLGAEHPSVGIIESNLGAAYYALGRFDEAEAHQRSAVAILEVGLGEDHPNVAFVLVSLGQTLRSMARLDGALVALRRAATIADPTLRPGALLRIGEILLERGEAQDALAQLERARALQREIETAPDLAAELRLVLARARWATGDRDGARTSAAEALTFAASDDDDGWAKEIRAWIEAHPPTAGRPSHAP